MYVSLKSTALDRVPGQLLEQCLLDAGDLEFIAWNILHL